MVTKLEDMSRRCKAAKLRKERTTSSCKRLNVLAGSSSFFQRFCTGVSRKRKEELCALLALAAVLLLAPAPGLAQASSTGFRVTNYAINATLFPSTHMISARAQVQLIPQTEITSLSFNLDSALRVQSVTGPGQKAIQFQQEGITLSLSLLSPLPANQLSTLTISYKGMLATADGSPVEGLKLSYVSPEGSYLLYPSWWFPVRADGLDRFTSTLHITVPQGQTVIAPGEAIPPQTTPDGVVYSFHYDRQSFPGTVIAGPYVSQPTSATGVDVKFYLDKKDAGYAAAYGAATKDILTYYASTFGLLPVRHLDIVEIDNGTVGGYSAPGVVALAARGFTNPVDTSLLAHEISHQWWRCLVSPASANDAFLDEGLATYSSALYIESAEGETAFEDQMNQVAIDALTHESAAPIAQAGRLHPFSPEYQSIVFDKGAMVLHMLRWVVGDSAFFGTLRSMARQYAWKAVNTTEFQTLADQNSHQQLTYFFAQWVDSTGVPQFKDQWAIYRTQRGYQVVGKMQQDLDIFRMPVEVRVYVRGSKPVDQRVDMVGTTADFTIDTAFHPVKVVIDPASYILKFTPNTNLKVEMARADQLAQAEEYFSAIDEYRKVLQDNPNDSLAHFRIGDILFKLHNYNASLEEFQNALNGDLDPKWVEVWSYLKIGQIFDVTGQRDRALNEYERALHTNDNTQGALELANRYIQKPYSEKTNQLG
ncbi:MAG: M1 family aminopeptidase [Terriglobia bacterium]